MMVQKNDMKEMMQGMRQRFEDERSKMMANVERVSDLLRAVDEMEAVISENGNLMKEVEMLRGQLKEEKEQREKVEMQLKEMSKLSASVAGKMPARDLPTSSAPISTVKIRLPRAQHVRLRPGASHRARQHGARACPRLATMPSM